MKKRARILLTVELVPRPMWGKNVRKIVSQKTWKELRWAFHLDHGACEICGRRESGETLHLHEQWSYNDASCTQKLKALVAICQYCHEVKHIGRAMKVGDGHRAMQHLCATNDWNEKQTSLHVEEALAQWEERSSKNWTLDLSLLRERIPETQIHEQWLSASPTRPSNPLEARLWAATVLESDARILDTETTGLPNKHVRSEIIEIAVLSPSGRVIFESLVKPKYRIPKRTVRINGITNEDVVNAPTFPEIFDDIRLAIQGKHVIAYKTEFDSQMLDKTCGIYNLKGFDCNWDCAMWAYYFYKGATTGRLPGLPNSRHRARGDCEAIIELLNTMATGKVNYYGRIDPDFLEKWAASKCNE